jgi:hypothetical protein
MRTHNVTDSFLTQQLLNVAWKNPTVTRYDYLAFVCFNTAFFGLHELYDIDEYDDEVYSRWKDAQVIRLKVLQQHFLRVSENPPLSPCFQILTYKFLHELGCEMLLQSL